MVEIEEARRQTEEAQRLLEIKKAEAAEAERRLDNDSAEALRKYRGIRGRDYRQSLERAKAGVQQFRQQVNQYGSEVASSQQAIQSYEQQVAANQSEQDAFNTAQNILDRGVPVVLSGLPPRVRYWYEKIRDTNDRYSEYSANQQAQQQLDNQYYTPAEQQWYTPAEPPQYESRMTKEQKEDILQMSIPEPPKPATPQITTKPIEINTTKNLNNNDGLATGPGNVNWNNSLGNTSYLVNNKSNKSPIQKVSSWYTKEHNAAKEYSKLPGEDYKTRKLKALAKLTVYSQAAVVDAPVSIISSFFHPIKTVQSIYNTAKNPKEFWKATKATAKAEPYQFAGELTGNVLVGELAGGGVGYASKAAKNQWVKLGTKYVEPEKVIDIRVLKGATFPEAKNVPDIIKYFESSKEGNKYVGVTATSKNPKRTDVFKSGFKGNKNLEDAGTWISAKEHASPYFLGIENEGKTYKFSLNPLKQVKPAIVEIEFNQLKKLPPDVIKKGNVLISKRGKVEGYKFANEWYGKNSKLGQAYIPLRSERWETREIQAIIPGSTPVKTTETSLWGLKDYSRYTKYKGRNVPIKRYAIINNELVAETNNLKKVNTEHYNPYSSSKVEYITPKSVTKPYSIKVEKSYSDNPVYFKEPSSSLGSKILPSKSYKSNKASTSSKQYFNEGAISSGIFNIQSSKFKGGSSSIPKGMSLIKSIISKYKQSKSSIASSTKNKKSNSHYFGNKVVSSSSSGKIVKTPDGRYIVYVKRYGEDTVVAITSTLQDAKKALTSNLKSTLQASGFIMNKGSQKQDVSDLFGGMFTSAKRDSFRLVQRRGKRLSSRSEVWGIQSARKSSSKYGRTKLKWW